MAWRWSIGQRRVSIVRRRAAGSFELVYSGDVKIYENSTMLCRARFVLSDAHVAASDDEAVQLMQALTFDPAKKLSSVIRDGDEGSGERGSSLSSLRHSVPLSFPIRLNRS